MECFNRKKFELATFFEIFSTVILSLPLIQEGQLSVLAKEYAQCWLTARLSQPNTIWLGEVTVLNMTPLVDCAVKPQHKQKCQETAHVQGNVKLLLWMLRHFFSW